MTEKELQERTSSLLQKMTTKEEREEIPKLTREQLLENMTPEENQLLAMVPQQMQDKIFKVLGMQ